MKQRCALKRGAHSHQTGDPLKDISQCVAVLLHSILVNMSFISLYSKHIQTLMTLVSQ